MAINVPPIRENCVMHIGVNSLMNNHNFCNIEYV